MEGGAMRGMFTAGVTDVLMENGIRFDGAIGVSAGAVFGCNFKSEQIGRVIRYNLRFCKEPKFCSLRSLVRTGDLYGAEFCYRTLPHELDRFDVEAYRSNPMDFYVVCTDADTGEAVYHNCLDGDDEDIDWMRASASMPLAARPVLLDGRRLLDGGVADSIPIRYFESIGYDKNVLILTQPKGYRKKPQSKMKMIRLLLRKYPNLVEKIENRYRIYNETLDYILEKEKAGEILVIRPSAKLKVGSIEHDPDKLQSVYVSGRIAMKRQLKELKHFLHSY